jgi:hypothetical protein
MPRGRKPSIPEREIRALCSRIATGELSPKQAAKNARVTEHTINVWRKKYGDRRKPKKRIIRDSEYDAILFQGQPAAAVAEAGENRASKRQVSEERPRTSNGQTFSVTLPDVPKALSANVPELQAELIFLREENLRLRQAAVDLVFRMNDVSNEVKAAQLGLNTVQPGPEFSPAEPAKKRRGRPPKKKP